MTEKSYPYLDDNGSVVVSPVTLVAHLDLRPVTLGERLSRYMRTPNFQHDINSELGFDDRDDLPDDVDVDGDTNPMSRHEDRARDLQDRGKRRRFEEGEKKKEADRLAAKAEKDAFRARMKEIQAEVDQPLLNSPPAEQ